MSTADLMEKQQFVQEIYEGRMASLQRFVGFLGHDRGGALRTRLRLRINTKNARFERRRTQRQLAGTVHRAGTTVEYQLVLAPDTVYVADGQIIRLGALGQQALALGHLLLGGRACDARHHAVQNRSCHQIRSLRVDAPRGRILRIVYAR